MRNWKLIAKLRVEYIQRSVHYAFSLLGFKSCVINRNGILRGRWMSPWCKLLQPHRCCSRLNLVTPWSWETSHFPKLLLIWSDSADLLQHFSCWRCYKPAFHMHNIHAILPLTDTCYNLFENQHLHNRKVLELWLWLTWRNRDGLNFLDVYVEVHLDRCHMYMLYYTE